MSVFFIIQTDEITDIAMYKEYASKARPILESFGGKYLVSTDKIMPVGGDWNPLKVIIIEFPDMISFDTCFKSPEYKAIIPLRLGSVKGKSILVESL